ncbi:hypothetical protein BDV12DRAFT_191763 [Aspergillus spectabilis]
MSINGTNGTNAPLPPATRLRQLLAEKDIVIAPGVYDGFSARIALKLANRYQTGAGTSASELGQPDLGFASLNDMREHAEMIASLETTTPLIADADTGYGGPIMVARPSRSITEAIQTKRCGHLGGKQVVPVDVFVSRITAAVASRKALGSDIVIVARTDALQTDGFDEAIVRLKAAAETGADVAFLEGVTNEQEAREVCRLLAPTPVLLNMVENGARLLGRRRKRGNWAIRNTYFQIKESGSTGIDPEFTPKKLFTIVGLKEATAIDVAAGGDLYGKV